MMPSKKSKIKIWLGVLLLLALVAAGALFVKFYKPQEEAAQVIETRRYAGDVKSATLENEELRFDMDPDTTHFAVTDKKNGKVWRSNPEDADKDPLALSLEKSKLNSTLLLTYSTTNGVDTLFNNFDYSIDEGAYEIEQGEDFIKVRYSIGKIEEEFVVPKSLTEERMEELTSQMDKGTARKVKGYYKKYEADDLDEDEQVLLEQYPALADGTLYILRDKASTNVKRMLVEKFAEAGYTYEDYLADQGASEEGEASELPIFNVSVMYRLDGNRLVVEIPMDEIEYRDSYPIYYLNVLPYFGAGGTQDEGYLLVPEGGGAVINFNNGKVDQNAYYANLYGWDYGQYRDAVVHETNTYFNAFGIAKNGASFLCILDDGAPYASVNADISGKANSYNAVSAQYTMLHREVYEMGDRYESKIYMYEEGLPQEPLALNYIFLDSESYVDMAGAYREYLKETYGELFQEKEADDARTPTVVELVGAVDKIKQVAGVPVSRPLELTTFAEAKDIIADLLTGGVGNLSVRLTGWCNGGVRQKILNSVHVLGELGGKRGLSDLADYAKESGVDLYLNGNTNYAYNSKPWNGFVTFLDAARLVSKDVAKIHPYSTVTYSAREGEEAHYLLKASIIPEMADNLADAAGRYGANVAFADIGVDLSSDFNRKSPVSRQAALEAHVEKLNEIRDSGKKILIDMGNNYAVAYSDIVTNMNLRGSDYTILDTYVPVYQMALHGYVDYTGEPLNLTQNEEEQLLLSAEYGAGLAFTLMHESAFTLQNTLYTEYFGAEYEAWKDKLFALYARYDRELGHTFSQEMVDHEKLSATLSLTVYADGTRVYVNHGYEEAETLDGTSVPARDYLVVR